MKRLIAFSIGLMALTCWVSCSNKLSPEEQAAQAALSYYNRILEGFPDGLQAAKADDGDLPDDYRKQRHLTYHQFVNDIQRQHGGLPSLDATPSRPRMVSGNTSPMPSCSSRSVTLHRKKSSSPWFTKTVNGYSNNLNFSR